MLPHPLNTFHLLLDKDNDDGFVYRFVSYLLLRLGPGTLRGAYPEYDTSQLPPPAVSYSLPPTLPVPFSPYPEDILPYDQGQVIKSFYTGRDYLSTTPSAWVDFQEQYQTFQGNNFTSDVSYCNSSQGLLCACALYQYGDDAYCSNQKDCYVTWKLEGTLDSTLYECGRSCAPPLWSS